MHVGLFFRLLVLVALLIGAGACNTDNSPDCTPGAVQECPCGGTAPVGTQTCGADGMSWENCDCANVPIDTADSDSNTGWDTHTGADTNTSVDTTTDTHLDTDTESGGDTETGVDSDSGTDVAVRECVGLSIVGPSSVAKGAMIQLSAVCNFNNGETAVDVTTAVQWVSSDSSIAPVSEGGNVLGATLGSTFISAEYANPGGQNISLSHGITVLPGEVRAVRIEGGDVTIPAGRFTQYQAVCDYSDRVNEPCSDAVEWTSDNAAIATVNNTGVAVAHQEGTATIAAALQGMRQSVVLTVTAAVLDTVAITGSAAVEVNRSASFSARCTLSDGAFFDCTAEADWISSNENALAFAPQPPFKNGDAIAINVGTASIVASVDEVASSPKTVEVAIPTGCEGELVFDDSDLEARIRSAVGILSAPLRYEDVSAISALDAAYSYTSDIGGIHCLTGLTSLGLSRNYLSDVSELSTLTKLTELDLTLTHIIGTGSFRSLIHLRTIQLGTISELLSLEFLQNLPSLEEVAVGPAPELTSAGIFALATLPRLRVVSLQSVNVDDLSALIQNENFAIGAELYFNPLEVTGCDSQVISQLRTLQDRGVEVTSLCEF